MSDTGRLAYNQREAAAALGMGVNTFKRYVRPHLKRVEVGDRMLFPAAELEKWLDRRAQHL